MDLDSQSRLAPGFRFHPTDEELIWYYLRRKVIGKSVRLDPISDADIYKFEPWELIDKTKLKTRDLEWYFYSALDKKYGNGVRMNRATSTGYWKTTGKDRTVCHESQLVGLKKTLVFHRGRAPGGERTNWVMHEYRLADQEFEKSGIPKDVFVLCRVFQKSGLGPPNGDRYAPFIEEEWDNSVSVFVPEEETDDDSRLEKINHDQNPDQYVKIENFEDDVSPQLTLTSLELFPMVPQKRKHDNSEPNQSYACKIRNAATIQDRSSSTTTAAMENQTNKTLDIPHIDTPTFMFSNLVSHLPPEYLRLLNDMQVEIHNLATEKAAFKIELMSAQAMINVLQSRVDSLSKELEDFRASRDV